jgi:L-ribulokinase
VNHFTGALRAKRGQQFVALEKAAVALMPGESGLWPRWNNGNRTILVGVRLTGQRWDKCCTRRRTRSRALLEATGFGAMIIDRIEKYGVPVKSRQWRLAAKNALLMQIYADITGRPMKISRSEQTPALGAAVFAAVAAGESAGGYRTVSSAQKSMVGIGNEYRPVEANHKTYKQLYALYRQLHDACGTQQWTGRMFNLMKELLDIRDSVGGWAMIEKLKESVSGQPSPGALA